MPPAVIGIGAALVGTVASAAIGAKASRKAGEIQATAAERTAQLQQQQFEQTRADLAPWRQVGEQALNQYASLLGLPGAGGLPNIGVVDATTGAAPDRSAFFKSPGYEFRLGEGIKAVERSAASRGLLQSGAGIKAVQRFGEGLASQEYSNYASQLAGLAGVGQQAVTQTGVFGAQAAGAVGAAGERAGAARASGFLGAAGQIQKGISGLSGFAGMLGGGGGLPFIPGFNQSNQGFPTTFPGT